MDLGFGVTSSIPPGKHEILYSYSFPYETATYTFEKKVLYGAGVLRVMWDSELFEVAFKSEGDSESVELGNRSYKLSESMELGRGAEITMDLLKLPEASGFDRMNSYLSSVPLQYVPPVVVAIVLLVVVPLIIFFRRRKAV